MRRTAALRLTVATAVVGALGVAAVAVAVAEGGGGSTHVAAIDPGAATSLARQAPSPSPAPPSTPAAGTPTSLPPSTRSSSVAATPSSTSRASTASVPDIASPVYTAQQPTRVTIGAVSVNAPVVPVGVDSSGDVAIPERISTVGWYRFAAAPGSGAGSTVLVGHVDSAVDGEGAFFRLRDVGAGDRIQVRTAAGRTLTYRVVSRQQFPKPSVPLDALFALTGAPRLTLITCGGSFDATRRSYRDNIVVTAVPVDG